MRDCTESNSTYAHSLRHVVALLRMFPTGLDLPSLAGSVSELPKADHGLRAVLGVADAVMDEPEALPGCSVEGSA
jgi:hypothetical protein